MKNQLTISFILLLLSFNLVQPTTSSPDNGLPDPPDGYVWKNIEAVKAYVLVPKGWFFNAEQKGNTYAYFITKEDYTKNASMLFETGFSMNVFTNMGSNNALDYGNKLIEQLSKENEVVFVKEHNFSNFKGKILRIKNQGQIVQYLVVANTKTNKLYLTYFESSKAAWEANEEFGKTIMDNLAFDPEF